MWPGGRVDERSAWAGGESERIGGRGRTGDQADRQTGDPAEASGLTGRGPTPVNPNHAVRTSPSVLPPAGHVAHSAARTLTLILSSIRPPAVHPSDGVRRSVRSTVRRTTVELGINGC